MGGPHSSRIQDSRRVLRHQFYPVRPARHVAAAHAPVIKENRPVVLAQNRQHSEPHVMGETQTHDEQHRRPAALLIPVEVRALIENVGHCHQGSSGRRSKKEQKGV